jgi:hypothetical protein
MTSRSRQAGFSVSAWALAALATGAVSSAQAIDDPCLLSVSEAREVGGAETVQAGSDRATCVYRTASSEPRLSIELVASGEPEGQSRLRQLEDESRYTSRKQGKARTWIAKDALVGWVQEGEMFVEIRVEGREYERKSKRSLEMALFRIADRLH